MEKQRIRDEKFNRTDTEAKRVIVTEAQARAAKTAALKALRLQREATEQQLDAKPKRTLRKTTMIRAELPCCSGGNSHLTRRAGTCPVGSTGNSPTRADISSDKMQSIPVVEKSDALQYRL
ncbi:hypothetical protein BPNPMPFG_008423 (plasmid) [Mesorhizobium sp. AR07]|uniref:hypothetical protein n=1 Tax=Mesorhizobium sp. AR07 TaxID=2865838 RepID=UPI00215F19B2|nr:hypothetical protein [Mesorhizobium sp. AR07]UVK49447.1 hypothetical protein BPNPMPFG_008423 [Mesorhizobium sp. AR07]